MISLDHYIVPNPAVIGRIVEGEAVLVLSEQAQVKVLNQVGARIWALADGTRTGRDIVAAVCTEYDVPPAQAGRTWKLGERYASRVSRTAKT